MENKIQIEVERLPSGYILCRTADENKEGNKLSIVVTGTHSLESLFDSFKEFLNGD